MKLYDISKDYIGLLESDLAEDEMKDCLECIEDAFEDKASNIVAVATCLDSDVSAIDEQIKRLQARKKAINGNKERLKEYLRYNMEQSGITKIAHPLFNISLRKPSKIVSIEDESLLPDELVTVKTELKPNKAEIAKVLKAGGEVSGAVLMDGKSSLIIK